MQNILLICSSESSGRERKENEDAANIGEVHQNKKIEFNEVDSKIGNSELSFEAANEMAIRNFRRDYFVRNLTGTLFSLLNRK